MRAPELECLLLHYRAQHPQLIDPAALKGRTEKERRVVAEAVRVRAEQVYEEPSIGDTR